MTQNLSIAFKAADFPLDGAPSTARAAAAARALVAEATRSAPGKCFPSSINDVNDGSLIIVYEPYPLVGTLDATPFGGPDGDETGVVVLSGKTAQRTSYEHFYAVANGHAVHASDPLSPRYRAEHGAR